MVVTEQAAVLPTAVMAPDNPGRILTLIGPMGAVDRVVENLMMAKDRVEVMVRVPEKLKPAHRNQLLNQSLKSRSSCRRPKRSPNRDHRWF